MRFLPMTLMIVVTAPLAGRFASKHGSRAPMTYGLLLAGGGLLALSNISADTSYWAMLPIFIIMGHGMGATMAPMTAAVMNSVGPQRAGLGSAMTNTSREVGGVFGIALLGTLLFTKLNSSLAPALASIGLQPRAARRHRGLREPRRERLRQLRPDRGAARRGRHARSATRS